MAVRKRWPKANLYACEFHLGRALRSAASADGIWPDDPLHQVRFERAFWTVEDWNALVELVLEACARPGTCRGATRRAAMPTLAYAPDGTMSSCGRSRGTSRCDSSDCGVGRV